MGDDVGRTHGSKGANALGLAEDAQKPFMGKEFRHERLPRG